MRSYIQGMSWTAPRGYPLSHLTGTGEFYICVYVCVGVGIKGAEYSLIPVSECYQVRKLHAWPGLDWSRNHHIRGGRERVMICVRRNIDYDHKQSLFWPGPSSQATQRHIKEQSLIHTYWLQQKSHRANWLWWLGPGTKMSTGVHGSE